ncbi:hypothetical protein [Microbacterium sp. BK668]|nr:hypothetical protein [Microbacterium sp. BK668]TDN92063.1 hypothetical protein EV279_1573 [Microbacterium sp. BK668]
MRRHRPGANFPDAEVNGVALSVGSGVNSDGILHSLTAGQVYTF